jgi:MFS family permease
MGWAALWPPAFALFALGPPLWTIIPLFVLVGFGFALFDVSWDTAIQERIPPHAISRVSSFDWMGSLALLPLGFLLAGPAAEAFGAQEVLVVGGLVGFGVALAGLAMPGVWRLKRLETPA